VSRVYDALLTNKREPVIVAILPPETTPDAVFRRVTEPSISPVLESNKDIDAVLLRVTALPVPNLNEDVVILISLLPIKSTIPEEAIDIMDESEANNFEAPSNLIEPDKRSNLESSLISQVLPTVNFTSGPLSRVITEELVTLIKLFPSTVTTEPLTEKEDPSLTSSSEEVVNERDPVIVTEELVETTAEPKSESENPEPTVAVVKESKITPDV